MFLIEVGSKIWDYFKLMPEYYVITKDGMVYPKPITQSNLLDFNFKQDPKLAIAKRVVKESDNYTCICCKRNNREIEIHAHHVLPVYEYPELQFDYSNMITLCIYCHFLIHREIFKQIGHIAEQRAAVYLWERIGKISRYYDNIILKEIDQEKIRTLAEMKKKARMLTGIINTEKRGSGKNKVTLVNWKTKIVNWK